MPPKKKITHIRDELGITGGGCYCWLAFEDVGKDGKAPFKCGMTLNFNSRNENYITAHPLGVYFIAFLIEIDVEKTKYETKGRAFREVERFIAKYITEGDGLKIISTTRPRKNPDKMCRGESEYIFTSVTQIHKAFRAAKTKYGGTLRLFDLRNAKKEIARKNKEENHIYTGQVIYTKDDVREN